MRFSIVVLHRPLVGVAAALTVGIVAETTGSFGAPGLPVAAGLLVLLAALAARRRITALAVLPLAFGATGVALSQLDAAPVETLSRVHDLPTPGPILLEARIVDAPERRPVGHRMVVDLVGAASAPTALWRSASGRVRLSVGAGEPCGGPGDRVRVWAGVRRPAPRRFPGGFSFRAWAHQEGVSLVAYAVSAADCVLVVRGERPGLVAFIEGVRDRIHRAVDRALPCDEAAVVRALATGDRSGISREVRDHFQRSGLMHLLAISGLHLAIVAGFFTAGLKQIFLRIERVALGVGASRAAAAGALPIVGAYTLLVGASPSAVRAALMVAAVLLGRLAARHRDAYSALAFAAVVMLGADPSALGDVSFQLSFVAVLALLRVDRVVASTRPRGCTFGARAFGAACAVLAASVAVTAGTAPLVAYHFGRLSLIGVLANVVAAPLASLVVVPFALVGGLAVLVSETLASPVLRLAALAARGLMQVAESASSLPGASVVLMRPTLLEAALFLCVLLALSSSRRWARRRTTALWFAGALGAVVAFGALERRLSDTLQVTFLPVGQGDATVVELPAGRAVLVDSGPPRRGPGRSAVERVVLPFLRHRRISRLDVVVLSHPHADHIGGLRALAGDVRIGEVWWTGDRREASPELLAPLAALPTRIVRAGTTWRSGLAQLRVLSPDLPLSRYPTVNDASVVIELRIGRRRVWLAGDAERFTEARLASRVSNPVDVFKVGHHGSRTSSTEALVRALRPVHAVVSCGAHNRFGFPHAEVLDRLRRAGATVWRTDRHGAITVWTDGDRMTVTAFEERGPAR